MAINKRKWALRLCKSHLAWLNWVFLFALLFTYSPLFAEQKTTEEETRYWVNRMSEAGEQISYSGTMVVISPQQIITLQNIHASIDGVVYGVMVKLDGPEQKAYRAGDAIYIISEQTKEIIADRAPLTRIFPSLLRFDYKELEHIYKVSLAGHDRVAGRRAEVIKIEPRDQLRFSFQVWLDQESGLPLRGQVFDLDGSIIEQITFGEIQFGLREQDVQMLKTYIDNLLAQGYKLKEMDFDEAASDSNLITLNEQVPGFKLIRAVSRAVPITQQKIGQWVFSDGLASISVFVEPVTNSNENQEELIQHANGMTHSLSIYKSGHKVILVGEVPQKTLMLLAKSLEFAPSK